MALSGDTVVRKHKAAIGRCADKTSWELLKCIINEMHSEYKK